MKLFWCILVSYFTGCINCSYIIGRMKGFDIRERGSGNAGGSNALIVMGKKAGVFSMLFDILKAFVVVRFAMWFIPDSYLAHTLAAVAVILGHMFPVTMQFRGGKGLACLGGSILAYNPVLFLIMILTELVLVLLVDYLVVVPVTASIAYPIIYIAMTHSIHGLLLFIATAAMLYKHRENFRRIKTGEEVHFSYLWHKNEEIERVKRNHEG